MAIYQADINSSYPKAIWKRWWNSNMKGFLSVCFFLQFLWHMPKRNWIFFSILFVALSHCDKDLFCLLHWVTATNRFFVCCTESLWQTKFVYVVKKRPKRAKKNWTFWYFCTFLHFLCLLDTFFVNFCISFLHFFVCAVFGLFLANYNKFVCCSDSVRQKKICLSQWLSATIKTNLCQCNKQYLKHIQFLCGMWQRNWKKEKQKKTIQVWILPPLSNCFGGTLFLLKWENSPVNHRTIDDAATSTSLQQAFNVLVMMECHHWEINLVCIDVYVGHLNRNENAI